MFKDTSNKKQRGQGITKVSTLFEKYKKILRAPQRTVILEFIQAVEDTFHNSVLREEHCRYTPHSRTLHLKAPGAFKTEILLRKNDILYIMRTSLGEKSAPTDIL